jgi:predicted DNA binding protein
MTQACIRIELSEGRWKTDVSRDHGDASLQLLGTLFGGDRAVETVEVSGSATAACLPDIDAHPDVDTFDVVDRHDDRATVRLESLEPAVLSAASRAGTPIVYPATVTDGELAATVVGTHARISSLGEQLRADGLGFEVAYLHSDHDVSRVLTDRQEEVLFTAVEHGYYRSPRECTLTEVAGALDIAKSTCSATLQRAEEAIVEYFCSQQRRPDQPTAGGTNAPIDGYSGG